MNAPNIRVGDKVMLVWACCSIGRQHIGWVGIVEEIVNCEGSFCYCDVQTRGWHAWVDIGRGGVVPCSWLRKMPPDEQAVREAEEVIDGRA